MLAKSSGFFKLLYPDLDLPLSFMMGAGFTFTLIFRNCLVVSTGSSTWKVVGSAIETLDLKRPAPESRDVALLINELAFLIVYLIRAS